jgi:hypothetical protein
LAVKNAKDIFGNIVTTVTSSHGAKLNDSILSLLHEVDE